MFSCDNKKNKTKNRRQSGDFGRNFWEYGYFVLVFFCIFGSIVFPSGILIFQIWKCSPVFCVIFFRPDFQLEIGSILFRECHTIPQLVIYVGYCLAANTKIPAMCVYQCACQQCTLSWGYVHTSQHARANGLQYRYVYICIWILCKIVRV